MSIEPINGGTAFPRPTANRTNFDDALANARGANPVQPLEAPRPPAVGDDDWDDDIGDDHVRGAGEGRADDADDDGPDGVDRANRNQRGDDDSDFPADRNRPAPAPQAQGNERGEDRAAETRTNPPPGNDGANLPPQAQGQGLALGRANRDQAQRNGAAAPADRNAPAGPAEQAFGDHGARLAARGRDVNGPAPGRIAPETTNLPPHAQGNGLALGRADRGQPQAPPQPPAGAPPTDPARANAAPVQGQGHFPPQAANVSLPPGQPPAPGQPHAPGLAAGHPAVSAAQPHAAAHYVHGYHFALPQTAAQQVFDARSIHLTVHLGHGGQAPIHLRLSEINALSQRWPQLLPAPIGNPGHFPGPGPGRAPVDFVFTLMSQGAPVGPFGASPNGAGFSAAQFFHATSILDVSLSGPLLMTPPGLSALSRGELSHLYQALLKEARSPEEVFLMNAMRAQGKSVEETLAALADLRLARIVDAANQPGRAFAGEPLPHGPSWFGQAGSPISFLPAQIVARLEGQQFNSFLQFCQALWKAVAETPELASQFSAENLARMRKGLAPIAPSSQHFGEISTFLIYHRVPISQGGAVFDMSNMLIVSPLMYQVAIDPRYHPYLMNILYSGYPDMRIAVKRRRRRKSARKKEFGFGQWLKKQWRLFKRRKRSKPPQKRPGLSQNVLFGEILSPLRKRRALRFQGKPRPPRLLTASEVERPPRKSRIAAQDGPAEGAIPAPTE